MRPSIKALLVLVAPVGLMVGADLRTYFTQVGPVVQVMAAVGYEAY